MPRFSPKLSRFEPFADSVKFDHFLVLTDDIGMLQHSRFSVPDRRLGYTTDDNAHALVVATRQNHEFYCCASQLSSSSRWAVATQVTVSAAP